MTKVAIQGELGAYSESAAISYFGPKLTMSFCREFEDVYQAVKKKQVNYGVLPIENSLTGSIHQNYDLMLKENVMIVGEVKIRITHHLLAKKATKISNIKEVYSHPQALSQCRGYFLKHKNMQAAPFFDTAGSAKHVAASERDDIAAIASQQAAKEFGLKYLARSIEDNQENYTRFVVVQQAKKRPVFDKSANKTSLAFAFKNIPGALHKALSIFAIRDIDLVKIESRPIPGSPWRYIFYLDFHGNLRDEACANALNHLGEITTYLKVLGCYEAAKTS